MNIVTTILTQDKLKQLFSKSKWHCNRQPPHRPYVIRTALYVSVRFTVLFDAVITKYRDSNGQYRAKYLGSSLMGLSKELREIIEYRYGVEIRANRSYPVGRMNICLMGGDGKAFNIKLHNDVLEGYDASSEREDLYCGDTKELKEEVSNIRGLVAHHINEDTMDDRIGNMELMTRAGHAHHHRETIYGQVIDGETGEVYVKGYVDWALLKKKRGDAGLSNRLKGAALIRAHKALRRETYRGTVWECGVVGEGLERCLSP